MAYSAAQDQLTIWEQVQRGEVKKATPEEIADSMYAANKRRRLSEVDVHVESKRLLERLQVIS